MLANYITGESEFPSSVIVGKSPHFAVAMLDAWRCAPIGRGFPYSERGIGVKSPRYPANSPAGRACGLGPRRELVNGPSLNWLSDTPTPSSVFGAVEGPAM